ncbi:hypothetical protein VTK73DRAFT_6759 [Phialemonium thermophilum]|uniref:Protein kinase domain-containing protein n=1 Tax=Phialemonium thermophilum TaxID=223376 RepID=A0ABR3WIL9_9PEZI
MSLLSWDVRTVLTSSLVFTPSSSYLDGTPNSSSGRSKKLGPLQVWNYLIHLSQKGPDATKDSEPTLAHFKPGDFGRSWDAVPTEIGTGASYSVEKWTLLKDPTPGAGKEGEDRGPVLVAVKRLNIFRGRGFLCDDPSFVSAAVHHSVATVLKEIRILTHPPLRHHPHIVSLFGYRSEFSAGDDNPPPQSPQSNDVALVLEFAPHGTLADLLSSEEGQHMSLLSRGVIANDIAEALDALHRCGIAHGDVKLENTLVFAGDVHPYSVKVSDFGHALVDLDKDDTTTEPRRYLGTPLLNAPEVRPRLGPSKDYPPPVDADGFYKCDIYSFGLLVWELLLNGARFVTTLGPIFAPDSDLDVVYRLNDLPKDELLLRALLTLREHDANDDAKTSVRVIRSVLKGTLRDDPRARKSSREIVTMFQGQELFRQATLITKALNIDSPPPCPLPAENMASWTPSEHLSSGPQMPPLVQADLVRQLRSLCEGSMPVQYRRSALFDLGICTLMGFGTEADLEKALELIVESSQLGSAEALGLVFRLHCYLSRELPAGLRSLDTPAARMEREIMTLDSRAYFTTKIRRFELLQQREALATTYDVSYKDETLLSDVSLGDLHNRLGQLGDLDPELLRCRIRCSVTCPQGIQGSLLHVAARLNLLPLLRLLFSLPPPGSGKKHWQILSPEQGEDLLETACRGGHLEVVRFLLDAGAEPKRRRWGTALHWLVMFPPPEAEQVLSWLLGTTSGRGALQDSVPRPGLDMGAGCRLSGTPLEIAIATHNEELVDLLLDLDVAAHDNRPLQPLKGRALRLAATLNISYQDRLLSRGWTDDTFRIAVSLSVSDLLPKLIPAELEYRRTRPLFEDIARYRRSMGEPEMKPFGLGHLSRPPDPLLPILVHGAALRGNLESTIDKILAAGLCAINDGDEAGLTALAQAVLFAPCQFNTDIISTLVSRGARFRDNETPQLVVRNGLPMRPDGEGERVMNVLLEASLLSADMSLLCAAVETGRVGLVRAILSHRDKEGNKLDLTKSAVEDGGPVSILFFALAVPHNAAVIEALLDHGADVTSVWEGKTPLEAAVSMPNGDEQVIDLLLARGAPVEFPGPYTILHRAASSRCRVNGMHVMYHLLEHDTLRALVNVGNADGEAAENTAGSDGAEPTALCMACFAGNAEAVHALLQAGANTRVSEGVAFCLLSAAVGVGRRPSLSPLWKGDMKDEKALYDWRLGVEDIVVALLDRVDPGHGMTRLHIAAQLGNYPRVVKLVEKEGFKALCADRRRLLPRAYIEDLGSPQDTGEVDKAYLDNIERIRHYLLAKSVEEVSCDQDDPDVIRTYLADRPPDSEMSAEENRAMSELEELLKALVISQDEAVLSVGDGLVSPAERAAQLEDTLETQRQLLGDEDPRVLRVMVSLSDLYCSLGRIEDAVTLHEKILKAWTAQLPPTHEYLYEAYMDKAVLLCMQNKYEEAQDYMKTLAVQALDALGASHEITLSVVGKVAMVDRMRGDSKSAISKAELALDLFDKRVLDFDRRLSQTHLLNRLALRSYLIVDYCLVGDWRAATTKAQHLGFQLELFKPQSFFQAFEVVMYGAVAALDACGRYEDSEPIYLDILKACRQKHGTKKSYCTRVALEKLADHYFARGMWEKESETLRRLADALTVAMGRESTVTLDVLLRLADSLAKQERWSEAQILRQQALDGYMRLPDTDKRKVLEIKVLLCTTFLKMNDLESSEAYGWEALHGCQAELDEDDSLTRKAADELGTALCIADKTDEAIRIQQELLDTSIRKHGEMHPQTYKAAEHLCASLLRARRVEEAIAEGERCVRLARELPQSDDEVLSTSLYYLANCKQVAGERDEAIALFKESLQKEALAGGPKTARDAFLVEMAIAELQFEAERYDEAAEVLRDVLERAPAVYRSKGSSDSRNHMPVQRAHYLLGHISEVTGDNDKAIEHFETAKNVAGKLFGSSAEETMAAAADLARVYLEADRALDAYFLAKQVYNHRLETLGADHEETVDALTDLSIVYTTLGMWPEAEMAQRDLLRRFEVRRDRGEEDESQWADRMVLTQFLATSCSRQQRHADAEAFGRAVLKERTERLGAEDRDSIVAAKELAHTLAQRGRLAEADEISREAYATALRVFTGGGDDNDDDDDDDDDEDEKALAEVESERAYVLFKCGRLDEACALQMRVLERDPTDVEELRFMTDLYAQMGRHDDALEAARRAVGVAEELRGGGDGKEETEMLIKSLTDVAEVCGKMKRWAEGKNAGERALELAKGWRLPGVYEHADTYDSILRALRPIYRALEDEQKLLDVQVKIKGHEKDEAERRLAHRRKMAREEKAFRP